MSRVRKSIWYLLIGLGVVVGAALSWVTGILEPKDLPTVRGVDLGGVVESYTLLTVLLLLAAAVLIAVLTEALGRRKQASLEESVEFTPQLRTDLLELLQGRYAKRLDDSMEHEVRLQLGMEETPGALAPNPNLRLVGNRESRSVGRDAPLEELFDEAGGRLLILGEPGSGKTTMLLELAQVLVERAEEDESEPVPVVVNLASWGRHGGPIREWLVEALQDEASVSRGLARTLVEGNQLLLLLDGLDEVVAARRPDCIVAINDYLGDRPGRAVVCSRIQEYKQSEEQLALERALRIEPLEPEEIADALKGVPGTEGLRAMLREDDLLRGLATTPLAMSVMLLAYGGKAAREVQAATLAERRRMLWDDYVTRMIARKPTVYAPTNILRWLRWLGGEMRERDMTNFIPDRMQPSWLGRPSSFKRAVRSANGLVNGLGSGLFIGLGFGLVPGLLVGLMTGLAVVMTEAFSGEDAGPLTNLESIKLEEQVSWSWRHVFANWTQMVGATLGAGVFAWASTHLPLGGSDFGMGTVVTVMLIYLGFALFEAGRSTSTIEKSEFLGARLRASRWNGLVYGLAVGLPAGLLSWLFFGLFPVLHVGLVGGLSFGVFFGLGVGFLHGGGGGALKFDVLRLLLWREGAIPWRYFRFLREASDVLLLQQVGGAVRFRHLLLRDYFAELTPERIQELSARIERT